MAAERSRSKRRSTAGVFSNRRLVAVEALLLAGWGKSLLSEAIVGSQMDNWIKVVVVMGMTVGLFGGVLLFLESLTKSGVQQGHSFVRELTGSGSSFLIHAVILLLLFALYAHMLGIQVF